MPPEDDRAKARASLGLGRELAVQRSSNPVPSRGGSRGYDIHYRQNQLALHAIGLPTEASLSSISRWNRRLEPYRMTGNRERSTIVGFDQLLLAICITVFPQAQLTEIAAFIYNRGGGLYSNEAISKRLKELAVTRKTVSVEAYRAFTPDALLRKHLFFTRAPPLGVRTIERKRLIDVDEFGVELNQCNRTKGWAINFFRVRVPGHYTRTQKLTVLIGIEPGDNNLPANEDGSIQHPGRWIQVIRNAGTSALIFNDFIEHIMEEVEDRAVGQIARGMNVTTNRAHTRMICFELFVDILPVLHLLKQFFPDLCIGALFHFLE